MSTEPATGQKEEGQSSDPNTAAKAADIAATSADPKVSEVSKLFDKLFSKNEPTKIVSVPADLPQAVSNEAEPSETFVRKVVNESDEHTFQRLVSDTDDSTVKIPDRFENTPNEVAVPPPLQKAVETAPHKTQLAAQDIPTSVDAVKSDTVKAELLAKAKAAQHAAKPVIDFPERVSNIKTQNDKIRARLESLERQE